MSKQLAQKQETALAAPAHKPRGFDNFTTDDIVIPRLRLLQALSGAVSDGKGVVGDFQDSLTEENLGTSIEVVLLGMKNGAVYFQVGKGMVCKSNDGITSMNGDACIKCPFNEYHGRFHEDGTPPKCSSSKEFMAVTRATTQGKETRPLAVSFIKSSYPVGKKIATMARLSNEDIFAWSYIVSSVKTKNEKGAYAKMDVKKGEHLSKEEMVEAERWYNIFDNSKVIVSDNELDDSFDTKTFDSI